jgi:hypothetical protein
MAMGPFGSLLETMADDDCGVFKDPDGADEINRGAAFGPDHGSITSIDPLMRHGPHVAINNNLMSDYDPIWYPG